MADSVSDYPIALIAADRSVMASASSGSVEPMPNEVMAWARATTYRSPRAPAKRSRRLRARGPGHRLLHRQRQREVATVIGPPPGAAQPGRGQFGGHRLDAELACHLGQHLLAGTELDGHIQRTDSHALRGFGAQPHLDPLRP